MQKENLEKITFDFKKSKYVGHKSKKNVKTTKTWKYIEKVCWGWVSEKRNTVIRRPPSTQVLPPDVFELWKKENQEKIHFRLWKIEKCFEKSFCRRFSKTPPKTVEKPQGLHLAWKKLKFSEQIVFSRPFPHRMRGPPEGSSRKDWYLSENDPKAMGQRANTAPEKKRKNTRKSVLGTHFGNKNYNELHETYIQTPRTHITKDVFETKSKKYLKADVLHSKECDTRFFAVLYETPISGKNDIFRRQLEGKLHTYTPSTQFSHELHTTTCKNRKQNRKSV